ncbi:uncharacterized protein LOC128442282 [Pleuronectes platessa]|uniref:uncharacterized protein LOC128442282 n=1 Tax=Pleuronectes platessa TaxID=8262 RepID=UPI00232A0A05|nr:uncharacterized protein LOC128442282 [Pleuronectes platessa]
MLRLVKQTHVLTSLTFVETSFSADDVQAFMDAALSTFEMAEDSGPEEELFGQFNSQSDRKDGETARSQGDGETTGRGIKDGVRRSLLSEPNWESELFIASLSLRVVGPFFQGIVVTLVTVAKRPDCSLASLASRYVLDHHGVGGVNVGCWLGVAQGGGQHISDHLNSCGPDLTLMEGELAATDAVTRCSREPMALLEHCGEEYRS